MNLPQFGIRYGSAIAVSSAFALAGTGAWADSIDPLTFGAELAVGESVTISKTVTVDDAPPTDALIDAFFLIDTSGSMGSAIDDAKAASADILTALGTFGDAAAGVGVFAEGAFAGPGDGSVNNTSFNLDITTSTTAITDAIDDVTLGVPDGGGSFPESSNTAIDIALGSASFRPGSSRFVFVLGDASSNEFVSDADVIASLAAADATLIGLDFGFGTSFDDDITDLGGTVFDGGTSPADIVAAITAGITAGFSEYGSVTVDDLGGGLPEIDVSVACTFADVGACVGADAVGDYDRSVERDFTFDVTFTRVAEGDTVFETFALVDGRIVASELDTFTGAAPVPLPATGLLLFSAFGALALRSRRRRKAA